MLGYDRLFNYVDFNCQIYVLILPTAILRNAAHNVLIDIVNKLISDSINLLSPLLNTLTIHVHDPFLFSSQSLALDGDWRHALHV